MLAIAVVSRSLCVGSGHCTLCRQLKQRRQERASRQGPNEGSPLFIKLQSYWTKPDKAISTWWNMQLGLRGAISLANLIAWRSRGNGSSHNQGHAREQQTGESGVADLRLEQPVQLRMMISLRPRKTADQIKSHRLQQSQSRG